MSEGPSRRGVLGGAALGLAASAAPALAQNAQTGGAAAAPLADPRTKFTREPFREQPQPWPGLQ